MALVSGGAGNGLSKSPPGLQEQEPPCHLSVEAQILFSAHRQPFGALGFRRSHRPFQIRSDTPGLIAKHLRIFRPAPVQFRQPEYLPLLRPSVIAPSMSATASAGRPRS